MVPLSLIFRLFLILLIFGCQPKAIKKPKILPPRARLVKNIGKIGFCDLLSYKDLKLAIKRSLSYLKDSDKDEKLCSLSIKRKRIRETLELFLRFLEKNPKRKELEEFIEKNFFVYEILPYALFTGYFEPVFEARKKMDAEFKYPIYKKPDDLLEIDLGLFSKSLSGKKLFGRICGKKVIPYYTREEIEKGALSEKGLEIAFLKDKIDIFVLQLQGSGVLRFKNGDMIRVHFNGSNGYPYKSIWKALKKEGVKIGSLDSLYLSLSKNKEDIDRILNHNPRYTFFTIIKDGPKGALGVTLTPKRSIATDLSLFPKGALAYIKTYLPIFENGEIAFKEAGLFVLNQDSGNAIYQNRVDLFFGTGDLAGKLAGSFKRTGKLYFLIKK